MARLILVRHAKSAYPPGVSDHERPLNDRGRRDAGEIGRWLDAGVDWGIGQAPLVLVSSATRAQVTWSLAAAELSARWAACDVRTERRIYEAGVWTLAGLVADTLERTGTLVIVGHNPGLAGLIGQLAVEDALSIEAAERFPTGAIAILEGGGPWTVTSYAVARGHAS